MGTWCRKCGDYDVWGNGCRCKVVGTVWLPESGETEDNARDVHSKYADPELAVNEWATRRHARDCECFSENDEIVAFRAEGERSIKYFAVRYEIVPSFIVQEAEDRDVGRVRKMQAKEIRRQRKYERDRRARLAAIRAVPVPLPAIAYR